MGFGDPFQHWWAWIVSMVGWVAGSPKKQCGTPVTGVLWHTYNWMSKTNSMVESIIKNIITTTAKISYIQSIEHNFQPLITNILQNTKKQYNMSPGWLNSKSHSGSEWEWESDLASWITIFWMLNQKGFWLVVFLQEFWLSPKIMTYNQMFMLSPGQWWPVCMKQDPWRDNMGQQLKGAFWSRLVFVYIIFIFTELFCLYFSLSLKPTGKWLWQKYAENTWVFKNAASGKHSGGN